MEISLQELQSLLLPASTAPLSKHPLCGKHVLAVSTNGFIHAGILEQNGPHLCLREAKNIRYWTKRDGGLPELAEKGLLPDDKIDLCHSPLWLSSLVFMQEMGASA